MSASVVEFTSLLCVCTTLEAEERNNANINDADLLKTGLNILRETFVDPARGKTN